MYSVCQRLIFVSSESLELGDYDYSRKRVCGLLLVVRRAGYVSGSLG